METTQDKFWNGELDESRLGNYVYALVDPRDKSIFYIGLAGGLSDKGNQRPLAHLEETRERRSKGEPLSQKQKQIAEIWEAGLHVDILILRRKIKTRDEAIHVEAVAIDLLNSIRAVSKLTNKVDGHGKTEHSIVTSENRHEVLSVPVAPINEYPHVLLFNISKQIAAGKDAYQAVRYCWKIGKTNCTTKGTFAVGLVNGISKIVVEIERWEKVRDGNGKSKMAFDGVCIDSSSVAAELLNKSYKRLIKKPNTDKTYGNFLRGGVLGVSFLGNKKARFFRGVKTQESIALE